MRQRGAGELRTGLILAGGYSTRFGTADKAFAELGGTSLIEHVADRLSRSVDGLLVSCRAEQVPSVRRTFRGTVSNVGVVPDPVPDRGPTAGIASGLSPCRTSYAAVVACDTPLLDPDFVSFLFEQASGQDGAIPRVDGRLRPTLAVYRTDRMRTACSKSVSAGDLSLRSAIGELDPVIVPEYVVEGETDISGLLDVNTPADLESAAELYDR